MSSENKIDPFAVLILVLSILGLIFIIPFDFAAFYHTGVGENRYSCLSCEYATAGDLIAQVFMIILLIIQVVIALNELLPNRFINKDLDKYGLGLAALTMLFAIIGIASFGGAYSEYEWWPLEGFYGGIVAGLLNTVLFYLKYRNK